MHAKKNKHTTTQQQQQQQQTLKSPRESSDRIDYTVWGAYLILFSI